MMKLIVPIALFGLLFCACGSSRSMVSTADNNTGSASNTSGNNTAPVVGGTSRQVTARPAGFRAEKSEIYRPNTDAYQHTNFSTPTQAK